MARDGSGQLVALKVLHPALLVILAADHLLREIRLVSLLKRPHIAPLRDWGEVSWVVYYTMAFIEGPSLKRPLGRPSRSRWKRRGGSRAPASSMRGSISTRWAASCSSVSRAARPFSMRTRCWSSSSTYSNQRPTCGPSGRMRRRTVLPRSRTLAKAPGDRWADADAMRAALGLPD
jgi:serine/threonine protein kinase